MNYNVSSDRKMSMLACKKILNKDGLDYTDEEIIKIRDWLYLMAELAINAIDKNDPNYVKQKKSNQF